MLTLQQLTTKNLPTLDLFEWTIKGMFFPSSEQYSSMGVFCSQILHKVKIHGSSFVPQHIQNLTMLKNILKWESTHMHHLMYTKVRWKFKIIALWEKRTE